MSSTVNGPYLSGAERRPFLLDCGSWVIPRLLVEPYFSPIKTCRIATSMHAPARTHSLTMNPSRTSIPSWEATTPVSVKAEPSLGSEINPWAWRSLKVFWIALTSGGSRVCFRGKEDPRDDRAVISTVHPDYPQRRVQLVHVTRSPVTTLGIRHSVFVIRFCLPQQFAPVQSN